MSPEQLKARSILYKFYHDQDLQLNMFQSKIAMNIVIDQLIEELNPDNWGVEMDRAFERIEHFKRIKKELDKI